MGHLTTPVDSKTASVDPVEIILSGGVRPWDLIIWDSEDPVVNLYSFETTNTNLRGQLLK